MGTFKWCAPPPRWCFAAIMKTSDHQWADHQCADHQRADHQCADHQCADHQCPMINCTWLDGSTLRDVSMHFWCSIVWYCTAAMDQFELTWIDLVSTIHGLSPSGIFVPQLRTVRKYRIGRCRISLSERHQSLISFRKNSLFSNNVGTYAPPAMKLNLILSSGFPNFQPPTPTASNTTLFYWCPSAVFPTTIKNQNAVIENALTNPQDECLPPPGECLPPPGECMPPRPAQTGTLRRCRRVAQVGRRMNQREIVTQVSLWSTKQNRISR